MKTTIKIFITGGTIDNMDYDSIGKAPENPKTYIPELLKQARVTAGYNIEILMSKDSRFITDFDRKTILEKCKKCKEEKIIITHGTATMPLTAKFLGKFKLKKTIVLTGSAYPANSKKSDALFNLGFAMAAVQILSFGVYVAMNGQIFNWNNVRKNKETGFFEELRKN